VEDPRSCFGSSIEAATDELPPRLGCFLPNVELFDAQMFGISPAEASTLDPQQRLLMQVVGSR
jgi:acyl transferase domain-containing protein